MSNRAFAAICGVRVPVVGRVSMDLITLDVSELRPDQTLPGADVELIGGACPLDEFAAFAGTMEYEIINRLGSRFQRRYINP